MDFLSCKERWPKKWMVNRIKYYREVRLNMGLETPGSDNKITGGLYIVLRKVIVKKWKEKKSDCARKEGKK